KLEDATLRQMLTVFAYGSHMGPAQMARSFAAIHARHLAWIHHEHMSEEKLDESLTRVVNGYHRFDLPYRWGSGKRASADGTKWEVYTHNLLVIRRQHRRREKRAAKGRVEHDKQMLCSPPGQMAHFCMNPC